MMRAWIWLDKPDVGCYFAIYKMCNFRQIIHLEKPQFPQQDTEDG